MKGPSTKLGNSGARIIANRLKSMSGGKVLDVATGDGDFIRTLMQTLKECDSFVGIDFSKKEIEAARKNLNDAAEFIEMNAEKIEFEDNCFDTVCIANSLHHLDNIDLVLSEMKRVLNPEGHFIVQEMFCDGEQTEAQKYDILSHNLDADIDSLLGGPQKRTFTRKKIKDIIRRLGLREVEVIESSRYVKCLFCDERIKCEDPKNEDITNIEINEIDENLDRLRNHQDYNRIQEVAEKIKSRIKEIGTASASILFITGKK